MATPVLGSKSIIEVLNLPAALNSGTMQADKFPALLLLGYLNVYGDAPACHRLDCADPRRAGLTSSSSTRVQLHGLAATVHNRGKS